MPEKLHLNRLSAHKIRRPRVHPLEDRQAPASRRRTLLPRPERRRALHPRRLRRRARPSLPRPDDAGDILMPASSMDQGPVANAPRRNFGHPKSPPMTHRIRLSREHRPRALHGFGLIHLTRPAMAGRVLWGSVPRFASRENMDRLRSASLQNCLDLYGNSFNCQQRSQCLGRHAPIREPHGIKLDDYAGCG